MGFGAVAAELEPSGAESLIEEHDLNGRFGIEVRLEPGAESFKFGGKAGGDRDVFGSKPVAGGVSGSTLLAFLSDGAVEFFALARLAVICAVEAIRTSPFGD